MSKQQTLSDILPPATIGNTPCPAVGAPVLLRYDDTSQRPPVERWFRGTVASVMARDTYTQMGIALPPPHHPVVHVRYEDLGLTWRPDI